MIGMAAGFRAESASKLSASGHVHGIPVHVGKAVVSGLFFTVRRIKSKYVGSVSSMSKRR